MNLERKTIMMFKRVFAIAVLVLSLAACGRGPLLNSEVDPNANDALLTEGDFLISQLQFGQVTMSIPVEIFGSDEDAEDSFISVRTNDAMILEETSVGDFYDERSSTAYVKLTGLKDSEAVLVEIITPAQADYYSAVISNSDNVGATYSASDINKTSGDIAKNEVVLPF
jgi:hypothetical protein